MSTLSRSASSESSLGERGGGRCGWLVKLGGRFKSWKRRWFVLRPASLAYYSSDTAPGKGRAPLGEIPLAGAWTQPLSEATHGRPRCFGVRAAHSSRTYVMQAGTEAEADEWTSAVMDAVRALKPRARGGDSAAAESEPWARASVVTANTRTLFGKTYTTYLTRVKMGPLRWNVDKRFSEFLMMHRKLERLSQVRDGRARLPALPPRRLFGNVRADVVEARKEALDRYLAEVLAEPGLEACVPVMQFLGAMEDREEDAKDVPYVKTRLYLDKLMTVAESGDVLLFRTQGVLQSVQRTFTSSYFDHAGVVIRSPADSTSLNSLLLLEATGEGVRLWPLYHRLRAWYLSDAIVTMRRLEAGRTAEHLAELERFGDEMNDKKYGLNVVNLVRRKSEANRESFFCSEVVAMAFKRVGWLPPDRPANSYFPASFGEQSKEPLPLASGAELSGEILVLFKKPEIHRSRKSVAARDARVGQYASARSFPRQTAAATSAQVARGAGGAASTDNDDDDDDEKEDGGSEARGDDVDDDASSTTTGGSDHEGDDVESLRGDEDAAPLDAREETVQEEGEEAAAG